MLGWEFPPFFAGGLGVVCYELTKVLSTFTDLDVTYVMPFGPDNLKSDHVKLIAAKTKIPSIKVKTISTTIRAYMSELEYLESYKTLSAKDNGSASLYGKNLYEEVEKFAKRLLLMIEDLDFDVIHAHDWLTYPAAVALSKSTGKPLVVHMHNTVYDRYLGEVKHEKDIESLGFNNADKIVAISNKIKNCIVDNYGIDPEKIVVIHNGNLTDLHKSLVDKPKGKKVVSYIGRVTKQKGVEYFISAAKRVLETRDDVEFFIVGSGDLVLECQKLIDSYGISSKVHMTKKPYTRKEAEHYFGNSNIFVMPSVSEPFGVVPFEAMAKGTPTIISKQSGISEVLKNTFKVDFWDIDEMADKINGLLMYEKLSNTMGNKAYYEFDNHSWEKPARRVFDLYKEVLRY